MGESLNIPETVKFKCDRCGATFRREITLEKHKNDKHDTNYCSNTKNIGEGNFGFAFDVRSGKEAAAEEMRQEWSEKKKDDNNLIEKGNKYFI